MKPTEEALVAVMEFVVQPSQLRRRRCPPRIVALAYVLTPHIFDNETQVSLAEKCGVTKQAFCKHVSEVRKAFEKRKAEK